MKTYNTNFRRWYSFVQRLLAKLMAFPLDKCYSEAAGAEQGIYDEIIGQ